MSYNNEELFQQMERDIEILTKAMERIAEFDEYEPAGPAARTASAALAAIRSPKKDPRVYGDLPGRAPGDTSTRGSTL